MSFVSSPNLSSNASRCPRAGRQQGEALDQKSYRAPSSSSYSSSAGSEVCYFESHSHAPEGLLIPISDTGPQSLIIYSCPPVNNKTKQNKKKMIETDERSEGKLKSFTPSEVSLPLRHCWPPYDDSHQNHNCLHCCHFLILAAQVFNLKIDLFQGHLSFQQRRKEKAAAFFIKLLIAPRAKAASPGRQWDREVRTKLPFHSYYHIMLCWIGHHGPHPDAQHNMDHSVYHLANIIR